MFFGNLRQDWREFIPTELGHQRYPPLVFAPESRAFAQRHEVDLYLHLAALQQQREAGEDPARIWSAVGPPPANAWLAHRRSRLLLALGVQAARQGSVALALDVFEASAHPEALLQSCLNTLRQDDYPAILRERWHHYAGLRCSLVAWPALSLERLELAVQCIPAEQLLAIFRCLLEDLRHHCRGLPDLIRFWPGQRRFALIEVKAPGDRLQDHQQAWLAFCLSQGVAVLGGAFAEAVDLPGERLSGVLVVTPGLPPHDHPLFCQPGSASAVAGLVARVGGVTSQQRAP